MVYVSFVYGEIYAEFLFLFLFVFPLMGKAEWSGNAVCWWLSLHFCFLCCLDEVSCTGCYWWLGDAGSCIQVVSFMWVLTIWYSLRLVSSVVVYGLGVRASTSKAQGLISSQEWRFHKWFVMALSETKTNIQKQETKDEPQTNGSYQIRQIIIKIMEYTHTHSWAKSKQSNKNKVQ